MKIKPFRLLTGFWGVAIAAVLAVACNSNQKEATATAKAFLQAYYVDLDFNKALQLSSDISHEAINEQAKMVALNPYSSEEVPKLDITQVEIDKGNSNLATCTYTCNHRKRKLPLRKFSQKWLVDLGGKTVESVGMDNDFLELSSEGSDGFAAAVSGEIKYKKRRDN